jgi:hypothetical protein
MTRSLVRPVSNSDADASALQMVLPGQQQSENYSSQYNAYLPPWLRLRYASAELGLMTLQELQQHTVRGSGAHEGQALPRRTCRHIDASPLIL